jgi:hypothetical protein
MCEVEKNKQLNLEVKNIFAWSFPEHTPQTLSVCAPATKISHIQVLVTNSFPTPPIKTKI